MYNMYNHRKFCSAEQKKIKPWYLPKTPKVPTHELPAKVIKASYKLVVKSKETNFKSSFPIQTLSSAPDPLSRKGWREEQGQTPPM